MGFAEATCAEDAGGCACCLCCAACAGAAASAGPTAKPTAADLTLVFTIISFRSRDGKERLSSFKARKQVVDRGYQGSRQAAEQ